MLLVKPPVGVEPRAGLFEVDVPFEWRECRDDVERFLLIIPSLLTLSAAALELEAVRLTPGTWLGDIGPAMVGVPFSISSFVFSSVAVPCIPIRKWSWFSIRKISTH